MLGATQWSVRLLYGDHTGQRPVRVLYVDVRNRRPDMAALFATARLERIINPDGTVMTAVDRSPLKATGTRAGYSHTIWPESHVAWDFLAVHLEEPSSVYLNSALDVARTPIISVAGEYVLGYEVFAAGFDALRFGIKLSVSADPMATFAVLVESPA